MKERREGRGICLGHSKGAFTHIGRMELLSHLTTGPWGLLYLQLQVRVNLRPQQAEEVGCTGELKPWNRIRGISCQ
jgi:hypothetical protein